MAVKIGVKKDHGLVSLAYRLQSGYVSVLLGPFDKFPFTNYSPCTFSINSFNISCQTPMHYESESLLEVKINSVFCLLGCMAAVLLDTPQNY